MLTEVSTNNVHFLFYTRAKLLLTIRMMQLNHYVLPNCKLRKFKQVKWDLESVYSTGATALVNASFPNSFDNILDVRVTSCAFNQSNIHICRLE